MSNVVNWFEISGKDAAEGQKLVDFYKSVFEWTMSTVQGGSGAMVTAGPGGIPGGIGSRPDKPHASVSVFVHVDDVAGTLAKVVAAGGKQTLAPTQLPEGSGMKGTFAAFDDPAGNSIGLWNVQTA